MTFGERWRVPAAGVGGQPISVGVRPESLQLAPGPNTENACSRLQARCAKWSTWAPWCGISCRWPNALQVTAEIHNPDFSALHGVGERLTLWVAASG